jgi:hypothetical protein
VERIVAIPASGSYINATADGATFTTVTVVSSRIGNGNDTTISLTGTTASPSYTRVIDIDLDGISTAGKYNLNSSSN